MAGKRGNNEGTITKRKDGRWMARMSLPDGKRKSIYGKTRQEVADKLSDVLQDKRRGMLPVNEKGLLGDHLQSWIDGLKHQVEYSSWDRYRCDLKHIIPALGKIPMAKVTPQRVQQFLTHLLEEGMGPRGVLHCHTALHAALQSAVELGLVQRNIMDVVKRPKQQPHEITPLNDEQAKAFLRAAKGNRLEALFLLAVVTGMRRGELLALRWKDVDLERGVVHVVMNLQRTRGLGDGYKLAQPKTIRSRRSIALSMFVVDALRQHRLRQLVEREALGTMATTHDFVFCRPDGRFVSPSTLVHSDLPRVLKRAELAHIRFHDLRHTAATLLLTNGVNPKVVSEMLGHATVAMTLDIYSHVLPHLQQSVADVMGNILQDNP